MPVAEVNGQRLFYEDTGGPGTPLVLSHGFLMDADMFEPQRRALAGRHRIITWDQRGHGRTEWDGKPFTYWDSADDLAGLLDHLGVERAVVGGMSQGGFVSLRFALRHPERTAGLVLIDTQSGLEDPDKLVQYDLMHDVWVGSGPNDQLVEMTAAIIVGSERPESAPYIAKWKARDPKELTPIYRTLVDRDDITDRLAEILAPVLVIHGEEDVAIEPAVGEQLCARLPGCKGMVKVPGAGHASNLTHPGPVNQAIEAFLG
ncbi:MAG TPA: alpha/beta hydrolase [Candidatus Dormibacteraeota bacterium]|nr:alpha/beta hydrolase [Candidatus Dormibacteraeota bacterium]